MVFRRPLLIQLSGKFLPAGSPAQFREILARASLSTETTGDVVQNAENHRVFLFSQQIHLQIEFCTPIGFMRHAVLTDENEQGQEDRFKRNDSGQKTERERIKR